MRRVTITHCCMYVCAHGPCMAKFPCGFFVSIQTMVELLAHVVHGREKEVGVWLLFTYHTPSTARSRIDAMAHARARACTHRFYIRNRMRWHTMHARISVNGSQTEFRQSPTSTYVTANSRGHTRVLHSRMKLQQYL